ncbi:MAG: hypothetical protein ISS25_01600 [Nanoarchaeota archaeon]|nr:hypothetical protein [DPANN group archaeon]MBL7116505.1 hypothetical protein [Nanoarchaeota archaeon]
MSEKKKTLEEYLLDLDLMNFLNSNLNNTEEMIEETKRIYIISKEYVSTTQHSHDAETLSKVNRLASEYIVFLNNKKSAIEKRMKEVMDSKNIKVYKKAINESERKITQIANNLFSIGKMIGLEVEYN